MNVDKKKIAGFLLALSLAFGAGAELLGAEAVECPEPEPCPEVICIGEGE